MKSKRKMKLPKFLTENELSKYWKLKRAYNTLKTNYEVLTEELEIKKELIKKLRLEIKNLKRRKTNE